MNLIDKLSLYLAYPFVRYALIVGVLIALCSSLLGVTLVLKRFSFIGDGLSHVAFGAMAIAGILNLTDKMLLVLPITIICAILLLRTGQNTKIKGDAAIAMISVGALAFGYLLMNLFSTSSNLSGDVCSTLFGSTSILTLTKSEVWLCTILSIVVVLFFILTGAPETGSRETLRFTHAVLMSVHIAVFALAGGIGNLTLVRELKSRVPATCRVSLLLTLWLGVFALVGCQVGWMLRPLVGSPNISVEFVRTDALASNFLESVVEQIIPHLIHQGVVTP